MFTTFESAALQAERIPSLIFLAHLVNPRRNWGGIPSISGRTRHTSSKQTKRTMSQNASTKNVLLDVDSSTRKLKYCLGGM